MSSVASLGFAERTSHARVVATARVDMGRSVTHTDMGPTFP